MIKLAFFDAKPYDKMGFDLYASQNNIKIKYFEARLTSDTVGLAQGYDAVCIFVNDEVDEYVISKLYDFNVKAILLRCAGFNNVDTKASFGKIHIYRVPAYSPYSVAEHTMALLLTSIRRIHKAYNRTRDFNFSLSELTGFDLFGKTIGIIGTGKIGKIFANICQGFGMNIICYDKFPDQNSGLKYVSVDELFEKSDIISLHCPLTDETNHLINQNSIGKMKKGVVIINTSRGGLINTEDLIEAIKDKKVGAACLDVYEEENDIFFRDFSNHIVQDDQLARLISLPNVIVTSHQAFLTKEALDNIAQTTISNLIAHFSGNPHLNNEVCYVCTNKENCQKIKNGKCF